MSTPGGNSIINGGQIAAVGTDAQRKSGIEDSVELMMNDVLAAGSNLNHSGLIRRMIEESDNTIKWTVEELGVRYRERVTQMGGHSVPRTLSTENATGRDIIRPMLDICASLPNVQICVRTALEKFVLADDSSNRVIGVQVHKKDTDHTETIFSRMGVILATGGFGSDKKFRSVQNPSFGDNVMSTNHPGATAESLKTALKIGAMPVQLSRIQLGPWASPDEGGFGKAPFFCAGAAFPYGIIVDPVTSKRFVNELGNRYERSIAILKTGRPAVCLVDSSGAQHSLKPVDTLRPAVKSFSSLQDLALKYGMDPEALLTTIKEYNSSVVAGRDDKFGKPYRQDMLPIETPPFYASRLWPKVHHCMGGLHVDEDMRVLDLDGQIIPGLYAAGEVTGGIHGGDRLGSCATLDCLFHGRLAGRNAVAVIEK